MTLLDFCNKTSGLTLDYEIRMSCHSKRIITQHPEWSNNGYFYSENDVIIFEIDWDSKIKTTLLDFGECYSNYDNNTKIISIDSDDDSVIQFTDIIVDEKNKYIILA